MKDKPEKKQTGKVNYVWVLAGGYLIYLALQLFRNVWAETSDDPVVGVAGGVAFTVIGVALILREWRAYQYGKAHIDDPSTWSDEPEEPGELGEMEEKGGEDA